MSDAAPAGKTSVFRVMLGESGWTVREEGGEATPYTSRREAVREAAAARPGQGRWRA